MADVSEKHIQRAANLAKEGQTFEGRRDRIAAALANAEREGMKRAAEIAAEPVVVGNQHQIEACIDFMEAWELGTEDASRCMSASILSEAGEA